MNLFNINTVLITISSVLATALCIHFNIIAKFPDLLIGMAIVFPVVFSISSAFNRREYALQKLSEFKGHLISIYFAAKDWPTKTEINTLPEKLKIEIHQIMHLLKQMLKEKNNWKNREKQMYVHIGHLSAFINEMRILNVQSGEISRANQYISKIIIAFDSLRSIYLYRTPKSLRLFSKIFIYSFPVLYAPYFAAIAKDFSSELKYAMPVLYSFILISLHNIQENLEHPFDHLGDDDIMINTEDEMIMIQ